MKLEAALSEYGLQERRRTRGAENPQTSQVVAVALQALQEFLVEYSAFAETAEVTADSLFEFLLEYYPGQEDPDPDVAIALLEVVSGFSLWLLERGDRGTAAFARQQERLRVELPRALRAFTLLRDYAARDRISATIEAGPEDDIGTEQDEIEAATVASSGLDHVVRLDEVRYEDAAQEYFRLVRLDGDGAWLTSSGREAMGEGLAGPLRLPEGAAALLRPGDIVHAEIAPATVGWELLEVFGVRPQVA